MDLIKTDICVIGGGSAGLSLAAGAVQMGAKTVLIEDGKMGGDCLNYGCIPSKSLIAAARVAHTARRGAAFGISCDNVGIDFRRVHDHVHEVIDSIAPHDSVERFEKLGVRVIQASGSFASRKEVIAGDYRIRARYFAIATGSSAIVPPIAGLLGTGYLTNETIFSLTERPEHLLVIGMGPIGCELSQAFSRLGSKVSMISSGEFMPREDGKISECVWQSFIEDGVQMIESAEIVSVEESGSFTINYLKRGAEHSLSGTHLLVAAGRVPSVRGLNLAAAGVVTEGGIIKTDSRLRTSNKRIFALGDVRGGGQFTHMAGYDAGIAIRNMLFKLRARTDGVGGHVLLPRVTYTDPEVASAGLSESEARSIFGDSICVVNANFADNDRARSERATNGMIKVITDRGGKILGVSICGSHIGDLLLPWIMAISDGKKIGAMAGYIVPYPTFSEITKQVSSSYFKDRLFSKGTRRLVRFLMRFFS